MSVHERKFDTYQSWDEIFKSEDDKVLQFKDFLQESRDAYSSNNSLAGEETQTDPITGVQTIYL
ncbi:MAG: hypothetical protein AAB546_01315 [Patescibacteria group bacterium]